MTELSLATSRGGQPMRLSKISITNFRNFKHIEVQLDKNAVIVGENQAGKSNFLHALRLVLDPTLPDSMRQLRQEDFHENLPGEPWADGLEITISVEFQDYVSDVREHAAFADFLISTSPPIAALTYRFFPKDGTTKPFKISDYTWEVYGGRPDNKKCDISNVRKHVPLELLPALRDAEADLAAWRNSPLRPLLAEVIDAIDTTQLDPVTQHMDEVSKVVKAITSISSLNTSIQTRLNDMLPDVSTLTTELGFAPSDPKRILRSLRLFVGDVTTRALSENSLGISNVVYLSLLALAYEQKERVQERVRTLVAIEEPEAHLHPHYQRLVFRDFLAKRAPVFLTTHSPNIVSVTPVSQLVVLRRTKNHGTVARSAASANLSSQETTDLARYLDTTRGEMVFARAILMVEGPAEQFLIPAFAKRLNLDIDENGVSVCAVMGTDFAPYVKFVGPNSLDIPYAVLTDGDQRVSKKTNAVVFDGALRAGRLLHLVGVDTKKTKTPQGLITLGEAHGIFVGTATLEIDLVAAGFAPEMEQTFVDLGAKTRRLKLVRAALHADLSKKANADALLKQVEFFGKGRFAQRLSEHILKSATPPPPYIERAIQYVVNVAKSQ